MVHLEDWGVRPKVGVNLTECLFFRVGDFRICMERNTCNGFIRMAWVHGRTGRSIVPQPRSRESDAWAYALAVKLRFQILDPGLKLAAKELFFIRKVPGK